MLQHHLDNIFCNFSKRSSSLFRDDIADNNANLSEEIKDKSVLVIGGAGSIGSSYIKLLLQYPIAKLIVVDHSENGLAELIRQIRSTKYKHRCEVRAYPINFGDLLFKQLFVANGPFDIVANFAALKHVRSEKDIYSVKALLKNNVLLNFELLELLSLYPPEHFFCVSTDKATNPVNVMGATKHLLELLMFSYKANFSVHSARFANVAFSNGSLLESFIKRMENNQAIVCPKDIRRFFVSFEEAGQLCLISSCLTNHAEIVYPKLEENDLIQLTYVLESFLTEYNLSPLLCKSESEALDAASNIDSHLKSNKYPIYLFNSDTTGEKSFEEFFSTHDLIDPTRYKNIGIIQNNSPSGLSESIYKEGVDLINNDIEKKDVIAYLHKWIPDFHHIEKGINLDDKM